MANEIGVPYVSFWSPTCTLTSKVTRTDYRYIWRATYIGQCSHKNKEKMQTESNVYIH